MPGDTRRSPGDSAAERRAELDRLRIERDGLNDQIRTCLADVETLASAVALFDRRARAEAEARNPGRAPRGGAS